MKKTTLTLLITFAFLAFFCNQQAKATNGEYQGTGRLNIFSFHWKSDRYQSLVSLSSIDPICRNFDLFEETDFVYFGDWEQHEDNRFFELSAEYRRQFLERVNISETDTVFVFDYVKDILLAFSVNELRVVAFLELLQFRDTPPFPICNYHIGFAINNDKLTELDDFPELSDYYTFSIGRSALVYVGKTHPFVRGGLTPIVWERIDAENFPADRTQRAIEAYQIRSTYLFEWNRFRLYLQEWQGSADDRYHSMDDQRHLLVLDKESDTLAAELVSFSGYFGFMPLFVKGHDNNWHFAPTTVGYLFQNRPPVIVEFVEFYCDFFLFLDLNTSSFFVLCDDRWLPH